MGVVCVGPAFIISNVHEIFPLTTDMCWPPGVSEYRNNKCPNCISFYNKHMGGVDTLDSLVSNYRIGIRRKKCYSSHFINIIDVLKSRAFKIYKMANPKSNIDFL